MIHDDAARLLAAGAALDDLEDDERLAYDDHRAGCDACAVLEDELAMVLADIALIVPERMPPPDLFAGVRRAIAAEDARGPRLAAPAPAPTPAPAAVIPIAEARAARSAAAASGIRRPVSAALGIAAVLALVAVGLGARSVGLQQELDRSTAQVAALRSALGDQGGVMAAAFDPEHVTVALESEPLAGGASAVVVFVPGTDSSYIVAHDLPATPSGHGYQLWYADEAGVHPLQTVPYDGTGAFVAPLDVDLAGSSAVMLTLEESGGAQGEPGPQVVFGEI